MTRMQYNWTMWKQLKHREDPESIKGISNFTRRFRGMHIFIGNFTYILDFMIIEDISLIIDPRVLQVVLGKPFVAISNLCHDLPLGIVRFANGTDGIAYKMPHKIELGPEYLSGLEGGEVSVKEELRKECDSESSCGNHKGG
nr:MAK10-like protein [Tanacetum cinerariifolium]